MSDNDVGGVNMNAYKVFMRYPREPIFPRRIGRSQWDRCQGVDWPSSHECPQYVQHDETTKRIIITCWSKLAKRSTFSARSPWRFLGFSGAKGNNGRIGRNLSIRRNSSIVNGLSGPSAGGESVYVNDHDKQERGSRKNCPLETKTVALPKCCIWMRIRMSDFNDEHLFLLRHHSCTKSYRHLPSRISDIMWSWPFQNNSDRAWGFQHLADTWKLSGIVKWSGHDDVPIKATARSATLT